MKAIPLGVLHEKTENSIYLEVLYPIAAANTEAIHIESMVPNNVLILGPPNTGKIRLAQFITNDLDTEPPSESHSGLIYACDLKTKYFSTKVNLLIEEFPDSRPAKDEELLKSLEEWTRSFATKEFEELREAIDGFVFTLNPSSMSSAELMNLIHAYSTIKDSVAEECFFAIFVAKSEDRDDSKLEVLEDECIQNGIEFVYEGDDGINEFKEKQGKDRVLEIFENHEWSQISPSEPEEFIKRKEEKMESLTQGLLENETNDMPLDKIVNRLRLEKSKVEGMPKEEKDAYVKLVVEDLMHYL